MEKMLPADFKEFLKLLNEHDVKYLLIGGYAVGYHGYPRTTNDIDIWVESSKENADKLVLTVRAFGFNLPELQPELFENKRNIIRMGKAPMRIEIITEISGVEFDKCYPKRIITKIDNLNVNIISLPDLKANKKATGRHKDLADLDYLP